MKNIFWIILLATATSFAAANIVHCEGSVPGYREIKINLNINPDDPLASTGSYQTYNSDASWTLHSELSPAYLFRLPLDQDKGKNGLFFSLWEAHGMLDGRQDRCDNWATRLTIKVPVEIKNGKISGYWKTTEPSEDWCDSAPYRGNTIESHESIKIICNHL